MLQTAASAWHDDDVAAAVGELLYRAMELAGDLQVRSLFDLAWPPAVLIRSQGSHVVLVTGPAVHVDGPDDLGIARTPSRHRLHHRGAAGDTLGLGCSLGRAGDG